MQNPAVCVLEFFFNKESDETEMRIYPDLCILSPPDESPDGSKTFSKMVDNSNIFKKFTPKIGEMIPILTFFYISNGLVKNHPTS